LALLSFIKPVETNRDARDWTISQFEELQLHAMSTLCILIPVLINDYFSCHGSNRLLLFLEWSSSDKSTKMNYLSYYNRRIFQFDYTLFKMIMLDMEIVFMLKEEEVLKRLN
jgi:hypothetical protein